MFFVIQGMKKDEVSKPELIQIPGGKNVYRIVKLMDKVEFHTADISTDYNQIKEAALANKKQTVIDAWVKEKLKDTYLKLPSEISNCEELKIWSQQSKGE